jgi:hypothetical protein
MDRNRRTSWAVRLLTVIGAILLGALFLGAPQGLAVIPVGPDSTEVAPPTARPRRRSRCSTRPRTTS